MEDRLEQLERKVADLEAQLERLDKQSIKLVGSFDGTNAPVTVQGIRRKIATSAP